MELVDIELKVPKDMIPYLKFNNNETMLMRNALLLYPLILNETISHGKAAELLEMNKIDLIVMYSKMGLSYLDESDEELEEDLEVIDRVRGKL